MHLFFILQKLRGKKCDYKLGLKIKTFVKTGLLYKYNRIMTSIISQIIADYGILGIILCAVGYLVWDSLKTRKEEKKDKKEYKEEQSKQWSYMESLSNSVDKVSDRLEEHIKSSSNSNINMPQLVVDAIAAHDKIKSDEHDRQLSLRAAIAPKLHEVIRHYKKLIHADHICLGSFHNGNNSMSGIPYFKFDIVAENMSSIIEQDVEFAPIYKDVDITRHDKLPALLFQNDILYYQLDENNNSELEDIDDIIYRRFVGRRIKQFSIHILKDSSHTPIGFVAVLRYDYDKMNLDELKECAHQLEGIYNQDMLGEFVQKKNI